MSLSRQLFALISLLFLIIFATNYISGVNNIRGYLQTEAKIHAEDAATSLAISLQPHINKSEDTILPTLINAIFDRGYYGRIVLRDLNDTILVDRRNPLTFQVVPPWFTKMLPLETARAQAEINDGWMPAAIVEVTVHPGYAYLKLWEQAKNALLYSFLIYLFSLVALALVLRLLLTPLRKIEVLAKDIGQGRFTTITPLPWTKEIKNVALAMNLMSAKIKDIIESLQEKLGEAEYRLTVDSVTGLETKTNFEACLKKLFIGKGSGYIFRLRIDNLADLAKKKSSKEVDRFLKNFADCVKEASLGQQGVSIYRLGGADFAIIAEALNRQHAEELCQGLADGFAELGEETSLGGIAHIGGIAFDPLGTSESIMAAAAESYNKARLVGLNSFVIGETPKGAMTRKQWIDCVEKTIAKASVEIVMSDKALYLKGGKSGELLLAEVTAKIRKEGKELSIGTFISVADDAGLAADFDLMMVAKVLNSGLFSTAEHAIAVNLSFSSIADPHFRAALYTLITKHRQAANRLVFCLTAYAAAKDLELLYSFTKMTARVGTQLMLKRYEPRFLKLASLKEFNFDYIRLAKSITEDLDASEQKKSLISAMVATGGILNTKILAEQVDDRHWQQIKELGIDAASKKQKT